MAIKGLTIIGESINDSVPSTHKLFDAQDIEGLKNLARSQDEGGAAYIDVNVGSRSAEFLAHMIGEVQSVTAKPLSIDTPDPVMAEAALQAYDLARAGGQAPVLNSISPLRLEMFDLMKIMPFKPILLISEREEGGKGQPNHTAAEEFETAKMMLAQVQQRGIPLADCIIDPAIAPLASDSEGHLKRIVETIRMIHAAPEFAGIHLSVGLSNFTVMLPPKRSDGTPTKNPLENAFLTLTHPLGLDHVIGSVKRNYEILPADHPAMQCVCECLQLDGFDVIMRVQEYYQ